MSSALFFARLTSQPQKLILHIIYMIRLSWKKMESKCALLEKKLWHLCSSTRHGIACFTKSVCVFLRCCFHFVLFWIDSFWLQVFYLLFLSCLGFCVLVVLEPRSRDGFRPRNLDLFFTSVSVATESSMSTVEMEVFSNAQLLLLTLLMLVAGQLFTCTVQLQVKRYKLKEVSSSSSSSSLHILSDQIELGLMGKIKAASSIHNHTVKHAMEDGGKGDLNLKYRSIKYLGQVVLGYLVVVHAVGAALVSLYLAIISSARNVLKNKGLQLFTFSVFTTVSTLASGGFLPTNENMVVFRKHTGLLIILIPQVLLGNTMFPPCLRFTIWLTGKFLKREESKYLLKNTKNVGFYHLLPTLHSFLLVLTVLVLITLQFLLFCSMDWNSEALRGMNSYEKVVGVLFQCINSRHAGETIVDISTISSPVLLLFHFAMYLPPYASFLPVKENDEDQCNDKRRRRRGQIAQNLTFSQLSYLLFFVILVCITERKSIQEDPLNFNVFNVAFEIISAYGNVGFTMGYSCKRQINGDGSCVDKWYGFAGRWSDEGKVILILVMLFGTLKKFHMGGGQAWKLL